MHDAAFQFVQDLVRHTRLAPGLTVEIGGRNINGTIRPLFPSPYLSVDLLPGPGVDVIADGAVWRPLRPAARVVCCEVFEHTPAAPDICRNAFEMLEPGGLFIVTAAGQDRDPHSAITGGPLSQGEEYYFNIYADELALWLEDFSELVIVENRTACDIYARAVK